MLTKDKFFTINIREYLALGSDEEVGEPALIEMFSDFSCPKNTDVERFLKKNSIEFTKKNQSVIYLVFSLNAMELLRYFTIALKLLINYFIQKIYTIMWYVFICNFLQNPLY